jgi:hypothetical protein
MEPPFPHQSICLRFSVNYGSISSVILHITGKVHEASTLRITVRRALAFHISQGKSEPAVFWFSCS